VSIASALGLSLENIAGLVGHSGTDVTQILKGGAEIMDGLFGLPPKTPEAA
jgi:hypothetical protein